MSANEIVLCLSNCVSHNAEPVKLTLTRLVWSGGITTGGGGKYIDNRCRDRRRSLVAVFLLVCADGVRECLSPLCCCLTSN